MQPYCGRKSKCIILLFAFTPPTPFFSCMIRSDIAHSIRFVRSKATIRNKCSIHFSSRKCNSITTPTTTTMLVYSALLFGNAPSFVFFQHHPILECTRFVSQVEQMCPLLQTVPHTYDRIISNSDVLRRWHHSRTSASGSVARSLAKQ